MKKILLLGGSGQQIIAIEKAKKLGYYTVLCDYLPDNPGRLVADKYYQISTTDRDAILKIAMDEDIGGIVAYSSDPAAPTAAYVSEKLLLPGIPYSIANTFCNKHLFRKYLLENRFNVPRTRILSNNSTLNDIKDLSFPVVIKPTDSSGSKGVSVIQFQSDFERAFKKALAISKNGAILAEEFIIRDHPDVIEAEIFVIEGTIKVWGLMNSVRDKYTNPLLPAAYSYPLSISKDRLRLVKDEVSRLISSTGVQYGAFNIEMVISKDEKLYFLDAGPRNGGNELPEFISSIAESDLVETTLLSAMGEYEKIKDIRLDISENGYWGMIVLHSDKEGTFERVEYDELALKYLYRESYFKKRGEHIRSFEISRDAIGLAYFHFPNMEIRDAVINDVSFQHVKIVLKR